MRAQSAWLRRVLILIIAVAAGWLVLEGSNGDPLAAIDAASVGQVSLGRVIYSQQCASCHGANLEGQPNWRERQANGRLPAPPHDASGHTWHHSDQQLFEITKEGIGKFAGPNYQTDMPRFAETLSDDEVRAVLAFIKSTWPARERSIQERTTDQSVQP